jgi:plastocyanin
LGDGGGANDTGGGHADDWYDVNAGGNGQDVEENMLGSVLRIDIDNGTPYAVPMDNPDISETYPEIWAYGFRNPYRMAFDPEGDHELFLGDAGQDLWEEVSIVVAGGNYGWNVREGTHCFSTTNPGDPQAITDCPTEDPNGDPLIDPIIEFRNSGHPDGGLGTTVVGGVVYRGDALPAWDGRYIFGQWSTSFGSPQGSIFIAERAEEGLWNFEVVEIANREGGGLNAYLLGFGQDQMGEVYALTSLSSGPSGDTGTVYRFSSPEVMIEPTEEETAEEVEIIMQNIAYQPAEITITVGTTVTWVNNDSVVHNVISGTRENPTGVIQSPDIFGGETFSFTFEEPGTYEYYCSYHPGMSATITVTN